MKWSIEKEIWSTTNLDKKKGTVDNFDMDMGASEKKQLEQESNSVNYKRLDAPWVQNFSRKGEGTNFSRHRKA